MWEVMACAAVSAYAASHAAQQQARAMAELSTPEGQARRAERDRAALEAVAKRVAFANLRVNAKRRARGMWGLDR